MRADDSPRPAGSSAVRPGIRLELPAVAEWRQAMDAATPRIVLTNGCFDLLHVGHLRALASARELGDLLVVAVNDDASVRELKGPGRPVLPLAERVELLCGLRVVDVVIPFEGPTASDVVAAVRPNVYVKGGDYGAGKAIPPEAEVAVSLGATVVYVPYVAGRSTSELLALLHRS